LNAVFRRSSFGEFLDCVLVGGNAGADTCPSVGNGRIHDDGNCVRYFLSGGVPSVDDTGRTSGTKVGVGVCSGEDSMGGVISSSAVGVAGCDVSESL